MKLHSGLVIVALMVLLTILEEINWLNIPFWVYLALGAIYLILDILGVNERSITK